MTALSINKPKLDNLASEIWKSAERLRGKFKAYEYQNVILPIIVSHRLECVLIKWREDKAAAVLARRQKNTGKDLAKLVKGLETSTAPFSDRTDWTLRKVYKIFPREDFAYHKVSVVFWQFDEKDQPATITESYEKTFTAANLKKEQEFYDSDLTFRIRLKSDKGEEVKTLRLTPNDNAARKFKALMEDKPEILSSEWTHRHYVKDDEYIPQGEDIEAFLKREIAKPIIRWQDSPQLGYEILPNKYFYRYQPPTPAKDLLKEFWRLEKEAEKLLEGLGK